MTRSAILAAAISLLRGLRSATPAIMRNSPHGFRGEPANSRNSHQASTII